jgi:hypothetical protein
MEKKKNKEGQEKTEQKRTIKTETQKKTKKDG